MSDFREAKKYCWMCRHHDAYKSNKLNNEEMIHCNVNAKPVSCQLCNVNCKKFSTTKVC